MAAPRTRTRKHKRVYREVLTLRSNAASVGHRNKVPFWAYSLHELKRKTYRKRR